MRKMRKWLREWLGIESLLPLFAKSDKDIANLDYRIYDLEKQVKRYKDKLISDRAQYVESSELEAYKKEVKAILERQDKELLNMGLAYQALDSRVELLEK